jgi:hypothetical protein
MMRIRVWDGGVNKEKRVRSGGGAALTREVKENDVVRALCRFTPHSDPINVLGQIGVDC